MGSSSICRICLDEIPDDSEESEGVVRLGCGCRSNDRMHLECATAWFTVARQNHTCEICNQLVTGLPGLASAPRTAPSRPRPVRRSRIASGLTQRLEEGGLGSFSVKDFLIHYFLFCLIPAVASSVLYGMFLLQFVLSPADPYLSLTISIPLSVAPIFHWCFFPREPIIHICGCISSLGFCMLMTILLFRYENNCCPAIPELALISIGAVCGSIIGFVLFHLAILPFFRLLSQLRRSLAVRLGTEVDPQQQRAGGLV